MTLLIPLGLLGLLGIAVLIIIYIIKPNYQQRHISSTFVWKLSLKYVKKRIPISKLRNLLIFLCQVLVLVSCALILSQPAKIIKALTNQSEVIAIIDSSASMRTGSNGETRFERAVNGAMALSENVLSQGGIVSVIVAGNEASYLMQRVTLEGKSRLMTDLQNLLADNTACAYGTADIAGAIALCDKVLSDNPEAKVWLYSDEAYAHIPQEVEFVNVAQTGEWNAAILNAYTEIYDNVYYDFIVDVACYGRNIDLDIKIDVYGANASEAKPEGETITYLRENIRCDNDIAKTVIFTLGDVSSDSNDVEYYTIYEHERVFSYQSVHVSINQNDSFHLDNDFDIYGGEKEVVKILYSSPKINSFFATSLANLREAYSDRWAIQIYESRAAEPVTQGYDFYLYEHVMPQEMPLDGVVFLVNPDKAPIGSDIEIAGSPVSLRESAFLMAEESHPIMRFMVADNISVKSYVRITLPGSNSLYKSLMSFDSSPMLLIRDEPNTKVVVMPFSVHQSNLVLLPEFVFMMNNIFNYFFPSTLAGSAYEVNERVALNARGPELSVSGAGFDMLFDTFPTTFKVDMPGTYTASQKTDFDKSVSDKFFVRIPYAESNIWRQAESLDNPYRPIDADDFYWDLLLYVASALVALLFIEWWLQMREGF